MTSSKLRAGLNKAPGLRRDLGDMLNIPKPGVSQLSNAKLIKHSMIEPNPAQPRKHFSQDSLHELIESIRTHGILQPLRVRPKGENRYEIIAGERRWRASQALGLIEVPCIVEEKSDEEAYLEALVENIVREDLNAVDRAEALVELRQKINATTWESVGEAVGLRRRHVYELLGLRSLPEAIQADIRSGVLTEKHGRALRRLEDDPDLQTRAYQEIKLQGLSGNDAISYVKKLKDGHDTPQDHGAPRRTRSRVHSLRYRNNILLELEKIRTNASELSYETRDILIDQLKELRTQIDTTVRSLKPLQQEK